MKMGMEMPLLSRQEMLRILELYLFFFFSPPLSLFVCLRYFEKNIFFFSFSDSWVFFSPMFLSFFLFVVYFFYFFIAVELLFTFHD